MSKKEHNLLQNWLQTHGTPSEQNSNEVTIVTRYKSIIEEYSDITPIKVKKPRKPYLRNAMSHKTLDSQL